MYTSKCYWEISKVKVHWFGKPYIRYEIRSVLEQNGLRHTIYIKSYSSKYGAVNYCKRYNDEHNYPCDIVVKEGIIDKGLESEPTEDD